jgi:glycine C-acetyltransferase/8-amino-7-oxononanoate synthase
MKLDFIKKELKELKENNLYRSLKITESQQDREVTIKGKKYLVFCSNNYLGLAGHSKIKQAALKSLKEYGFGSVASRLISGTSLLHDKLEKEIAKFKKEEKALVFPTGYMTNLGLVTSLMNEQDLIIIDKLNHASIIDGCFQSKASLRVYPHKNTAVLEKILKQSSSKFRRILIITDTVFSMDGDIAPLTTISTLANKYNALTMVDEAHATGVIGDNQRGVLEKLKLEGKIDIVMGTLSKALGSIGGYVVGNKELIDYFINKARSFIYTTSLPPLCCAASLASLKIIQSKEGEKLKQKLWNNVKLMRKGLKQLKLNSLESETQIIPILIGDSALVLKITEQLFKRKILIPAIRFPTVPKNKSRLRLTLMATHTKKDINYFLNVMEDIKKKFKI